MKTASWVALLALTLTATCYGVTGVKSSIAVEAVRQINGVLISWDAIPGKSYMIKATTELDQPWQILNGTPLIAANNVLAYYDVINQGRRFYQVIKLDSEPPEVWRTVPSSTGFAVSRQAVVRAYLTDETGIDPTSIKLTVGTNSPVGLNDPRLSFGNGLLAYAPGANEFLGEYGAAVNASLSVSDTLGSRLTNYVWSFQLELEPILSDKIVVVTKGSAVAPQAQAGAGLTLVTSSGNLFVYRFAGASSGLKNGLYLVDTTPGASYARTVLQFVEDPSAHTVTVVTEPTPLAKLFQQASLSSTGIQPSVSIAGVEPQATLVKNFNLEQVVNLSGTVYSDSAITVEIMSGSSLDLEADLGLSLTVRNFKIEEFETSLSAKAALKLLARVSANVSKNIAPPAKALVSPIHKFYVGWVGAWPVAIEAVWEFNVGFTADLEAQGEVTAGFEAAHEFWVNRKFDSTGWHESSRGLTATLTPIPPTWQIAGSADVTAYIQPKVTLYAYSVAGPWADLQPYLELTGRAQANPPAWDWGLSGGLTSTIGLDLRGWDDSWVNLPDKTFDLIPSKVLWQQTHSAAVAALTVTKSGNGSGSITSSPPGINCGTSCSMNVSAGTSVTLTAVPDPGSTFAGWGGAGSGAAMSYTVNVNGPTTVMATFNSSNMTGNITPKGMVWIEPGTFTMGSPANEVDRASDEGPQTQVTISRGFWMGKYEVTQAEYQAVAGSNPSSFRGDSNRPVEQVSWNDAVSYCTTLTERERGAGRLPRGYAYRLPTEAEWEYAARAGTTTRFSYGDDPGYTKLGDYAWYGSNSGNGTHPVGQKLANAWGLYDMAGNVWEWCSDWYDSYPGGSLTDPKGPAKGSYRVARGGAWYIVASYCRSALRDYITPEARGSMIGFRIVLAPGQAGENLEQRITFAKLEDRVLQSGLTVELKATSSSGLPVTFELVSGPGLLQGVTLTLNGPGTVVVRASQPGDAKYQAAQTVEMSFKVLDGGSIGPPPTNMVLVPAGSFQMGDTFNEGGPEERPVHQVSVSAFFMEVTEVSKTLWNMPWDEVYQWAIKHGYSFDYSGSTKNNSHPVESINWYDALKWCNARSEKEGRIPAYYTSVAQTTPYRSGRIDVQNDWVKWNAGYRLPTEAEWEKAARGGEAGKRFPWGNTISHNEANYDSDLSRRYDVSPTFGYHPDCNFPNIGFPCTSLTTSFASNSYGLYNMAGNVWEWCWDWFDTAYYSSSTDSDPTGPESGSSRALRGGSWYDHAQFCRSATRYSSSPASAYNNVGFRCVLPSRQQEDSLGQIITFPQIEDRVFQSGLTIELKATSSSGLPVRVELVSGPALLQGTTLTLTGPGMLVVRASQPGDDRYRPAPAEEQTFRLLDGSGIANMVWIWPGKFTMGSPANEVDRDSDEGPQTQVTISHGFWMGKYEVTQAEYQTVVGSNPSFFKGDMNRPVEQVTWNDAVSYCTKFIERERAAGRLPVGYVYRLPAEVEWEYAARAGSTTRFSYGEDPGYAKLGAYAWFSSNSANATHPVGQKLANDWGLYDMSGNVDEWCLDEYGMFPGLYRVVRGGDWYSAGRYCRSADRDNSPAVWPGVTRGFRVVLAPGQ